MEVTSTFQHLLFTTVQLEVVHADGGESTGTGFIYSFEKEGNRYPFVVTNRHVVEDSEKIKMVFNEREGANPKLGAHVEVEINDMEDHWHGHPNIDIDVAVIPVGSVFADCEKNGKKPFFRTVQSSMCPTADQVKELDAVEEVFLVGYPNGVYDTVNLFPIVRRGVTATPIETDFCGEPCFLVDASVFPGSSGSPVFLIKLGSFVDKTGGLNLASSRRYFLGVMASVYFRTEDNSLVPKPIPTKNEKIVQTKEMIDLGQVYKWNCVNETIEDLLSKQSG